ncbi:acyclic terpene utilization AtuA family protein [Achromobacter sp. DMS1]
MDVLNVGCGAGFSGDRLDAPAPVVRTLIARGAPAALIFETLAERTLAFAQIARRSDPARGYEALLEPLLRPILADCLAHGIVIVGNFGAANPPGAARAILRVAGELGLPAPRIAVLEGDDLSARLQRGGPLRAALGADFDETRFVSANVYQGAFEIAQAIQAGAQIVVAGRVADSSLTLGPAIAHFGWTRENWDALAGGTMAGHLLECAAQVTGGYYADPGKKDVPGLDDVGFPIAEIQADGSCVVSKADDTGGIVNARTVKEQLLYEVHDPAAYLTPDVVADIGEATVEEVAPGRVRLAGVRGHPRPLTLKAAAFFEGGWAGDAEISYAGPNAEARARLAMEVIRKRLGGLLDLRFDLIGLCSILGDDAGRMLAGIPAGGATDVRLRAAARHDDPALIDRLHREVTALWTGGPAGGGGVKTSKRQRLAMRNFFVPRELAPASFHFAGRESRP